MNQFEERVLDDIRRKSILRRGDKLLIALSGGPDSVCLAMVMNRLRHELGITLAAGHVNYGLRGTESDKDELFVRDLCRRLDIPLYCTAADPCANGSGNLEETARSLRYAFLADIACREEMVIATGHNSDDQAETFIFNLVRGSGYRGLSGMLPVRSHQDAGGRCCKVVRPLLRVTREQITEYLESAGQPFRTDSSNYDRNFDRNWIRHELLPLLESRFNPRLGERIARAAGLIGEAAQFLEDRAEEKLNELGSVSKGGYVKIPLQSLLQVPEVLRREMIRLGVARAKGNLNDLTSRHISAVENLLEGQSGRKVCLPGNLEARREFDFLVIGIPGDGAVEFAYRVDVPGSIYIPQAGKRLTMEITGPVPPENPAKRPLESVIVRNRRPGDKLRISRKRPRQSFSNLCSRYKIPESERDRILIIEFPGHCHWVEGTGMTPVIRTSGNIEITVSVETAQG